MPRRKLRRRSGRVLSREVVQQREAILEVGDPSPRARAVSHFQMQQLAQAVGRAWPRSRSLTVAVFARWPWDEPDPEGGYMGFSAAKQEESYGRRLGGVSRARHYYGWRSGVVGAGYFAATPNVVVAGLIADYGGRTPIRCVSVRPYA